MNTSDGRGDLREATLADFEGINALKEKIGWGRTTRATWDWLFAANPSLEEMVPAPPPGWVVERHGKLVGYFGNIAESYRFGSRSVRVGAATALVVDPECRGSGYGLDLVAAWANQRDVDLAISTTTSPQAARLMRKVGAHDIPCDHVTVLSWPVDPAGLAGAVLQKRGFAPVLARLAAPALGAGLRLESALRGRGPVRRARGLEVDVLPGIEFGGEFDALWERKTGESDRLLSCRTSRILRWHFGGPSIVGRVRVLCARRAGELVGYAALFPMDSQESGLLRTRVADVVVEREDPEILDALFAAAFDAVRADGVHLLEMIAFPSAVRSRFLAGKPLVRRLPDCPFLYRAANGFLEGALRRDDAWYAGPYDGDGSLFALEYETA
jgi:N-acetylglutamate synthase-like GNAT family acetyltransferase